MHFLLTERAKEKTFSWKDVFFEWAREHLYVFFLHWFSFAIFWAFYSIYVQIQTFPFYLQMYKVSKNNQPTINTDYLDESVDSRGLAQRKPQMNWAYCTETMHVFFFGLGLLELIPMHTKNASREWGPWQQNGREGMGVQGGKNNSDNQKKLPSTFTHASMLDIQTTHKHSHTHVQSFFYC